MLDTICPPLSMCVQVDNLEGLCECANTTTHLFNPKFTGDQDYCIDVSKQQPELEDEHNSPAHSEGIIDVGGSSGPPHHHILGGILIPIAVVLTIVGCAYLVIRYRIVRRIRDRWSGRRHRPTYQDVMMASSEFEPPLI